MSQITDSRLPLDPSQDAILTNLVNLADSGPCEFITKAGGVFVNTAIGACAGSGGTPTNGLQAISTNIGLGGLLTQDTVIDGDASYSLDIQNITGGGISSTGGAELYVTPTSSYIAYGSSSVLINTNGVNVETPNISSLSASVGQVLTLQDSATGEVEYEWVDAADVVYDNTTSGLTATDVQGAIDEIDAQVDTNTGDIASLTAIVGAIDIVSTDAGNDITAGSDGGAFFQETPETITTITNTVTGHKIADYTNEVAATVAINETVTSLGFAGTDLTYNDENGTPTVLDLSSLTGKFLSSGSLISGNNTLRLVMSDATNVDVDVTALNTPPYQLYDENPVSPTANTVSGRNSIAIGNDLTSSSFSEVVVGYYANIIAANSATAWDADDYAFRVGIGSNFGITRRDGFRVQKNGDIHMIDYIATRDDSGTTDPINYLYTDSNGKVLSASKLTRFSGHFAGDSVTRGMIATSITTDVALDISIYGNVETSVAGHPMQVTLGYDYELVSLSVYVRTNTRSNNFQIGPKKNGATAIGGMLIIPASTTGMITYNYASTPLVSTDSLYLELFDVGTGTGDIEITGYEFIIRKV